MSEGDQIRSAHTTDQWRKPSTYGIVSVDKSRNKTQETQVLRRSEGWVEWEERDGGELGVQVVVLVKIEFAVEGWRFVKVKKELGRWERMNEEEEEEEEEGGMGLGLGISRCVD